MSQQTSKSTKKQRRQLKRQSKLEQKQLAERRAEKRSLIRRVTVWSGVVLGLIIIVLGMIKITGSPKTEATRLTEQNSSGDWAKGNRTARVTLIEYSDFQCPSCARYSRMTKRLINELGDDLQLIFRHYPLRRHANAQLAAGSAEAAGRQGKFWEMHDLLFERQKEWAKTEQQEAERICLQYARTLNLDEEQFQSDLRSQATMDQVNEDYQTGRQSGVKSTPTFFLNGYRITEKPRDYEVFKELILRKKNDLP
jgi:protein-disulfide isomerase